MIALLSRPAALLFRLAVLKMWRRRCVAGRAGSRLRAVDVEGLANCHVGRRNHAALRHQHSGVVAYRLNLFQPERFQRDQRLHPLITREDQHLDRIERDAIDGQELLKVFVSSCERSWMRSLTDSSGVTCTSWFTACSITGPA